MKGLLPPAADASTERTSDIGIRWDSTAPKGEEKATNLKLVRPENEPTANNGNGTGKAGKKPNKSDVTKKVDGESTGQAETEDNKKVSSALDSTTPPVDQDLDMTGWSGDYNLQK